VGDSPAADARIDRVENLFVVFDPFDAPHLIANIELPVFYLSFCNLGPWTWRKAVQ
jgi:hypothetical protein